MKGRPLNRDKNELWSLFKLKRRYDAFKGMCNKLIFLIKFILLAFERKLLQISFLLILMQILQLRRLFGPSSFQTIYGIILIYVKFIFDQPLFALAHWWCS